MAGVELGIIVGPPSRERAPYSRRVVKDGDDWIGVFAGADDGTAPWVRQDEVILYDFLGSAKIDTSYGAHTMFTV